MKLSDFNYTYPKELIAQRPLKERDASRIMVIDRTKKNWEHSTIKKLPDFLQPQELLVINNSKVLPSRLFGEIRKKKMEVLLVEQDCRGAQEIWRCLTKKAKRIRPGEKIFFGMTAHATVIGHEDIYLLLAFEPGHRLRAIERRGVPPLPPYIEREGIESYSDEDRERYQTIYAKEEGSAAVPTAGLHFSDTLLESLHTKGIEIVPVTLHVGIDTFRPVQTEQIEEHRMHGEEVFISEDAAQKINTAKQMNRRIIACGTTTVRALESAWDGEKIRS